MNYAEPFGSAFCYDMETMSEKMWQPIPGRERGGIERVREKPESTADGDVLREPGDLSDLQRADLVATLESLSGANIPKKK